MRTLYGNKPRFLTPEDMAAAIDAYLMFDCEKVKIEGVKDPVPLITITGLALYLGFESRTSLVYYEQKKPKFTRVIRRARLFVEHHYEKMLQIGNFNAAKFALSQMGWKENLGIEHGNKDNLPFVTNTMDSKEAAQVYAQLVKNG
jgi:hypothetical protein